VQATFEEVARPSADHRYRRGVEIGSVLVDRHAIAVADQPTCRGHMTEL
jgi:hypothetical protein